MSTKVIKVRGRSAFRCMSPFGFHVLANKFMEAAKLCQTTGDSSPVPYFLCCRSIELSLKAFLLAKNVSINRLKGRKGVGHDLERALEEAELQGLLNIVEIPCHYKEELRKANYYYAKKQGFEYCDGYEVMTGRAKLPSLKVLSEFATTLVDKLDWVCSESIRKLAEK